MQTILVIILLVKNIRANVKKDRAFFTTISRQFFCKLINEIFNIRKRVFVNVRGKVIYWYADSFVEIGKLLGITEGNARLRLTRMRKQLKTYLTEQEVPV